MAHFKVINESFTCENCGTENPPLAGSCRNHCRKCLFSKHLDQAFPGDRQSKCQNLMRPKSAKQDGKKGWQIEHICLRCHKKIYNKSAPDDNFEEIIQLTQL